MSRKTGVRRRVKAPDNADENVLYEKRLIDNDQNLDNMYKHLIMSTAENKEHVRQMLIATTFGTEYSKFEAVQKGDWNRCLMYARKLSIFSERLIKQVDKMKEKYLDRKAVLDLERIIALKSAPSKPSQIPVFYGKIGTNKKALSSSRCAKWAEYPASKIPRWSKTLKLLENRLENRPKKYCQKNQQNDVAMKKVSKIPLLVGLKAQIEKVKESIRVLSIQTPRTPLPPIQKSSGFSVFPVLPDIHGQKKSKINPTSGEKKAGSSFVVKNIYSGKDCVQY